MDRLSRRRDTFHEPAGHLQNGREAPWYVLLIWPWAFQKPNRLAPSEHPNPTTKIDELKWVVHLPQNGTSGFDPQPFTAVHVYLLLALKGGSADLSFSNVLLFCFAAGLPTSRTPKCRGPCFRQSPRHHFGVGAPPILVYFIGDWDVLWEYGLWIHGHIVNQGSAGG